MTITPTTWLDSFQVNTSSTGFQGQQDIVALSNGNFLVVFTDDSGAVGTGAGRDIVGVIYDAEGTIVTTAFQVNTFGNADSEEVPAIAATNDGGFVMVYEDRDGGTPSQQLLMQRYDASGTSIDTAFAQIRPTTEFVSNPKIAVNQTDNSIFVSYQWSDGSNDQIRGKKFDSNLNVAAGTPADGYVLRTDDQPSNFPGVFNQNTTVLNNGNFVTVFSEPDTATGGNNIEFRISNGTTGANSSNVNVSTSGGDEDIQPDVAALTGGGFVVAWREVETTTNGNDTGDNILFARYSSTGSLQGTITTVIDSGNEYSDAAVIGLEDGGFYIAVYDGSTDSIEGTRYDSLGNQVGLTVVNIQSGITNFPDIELSLTTDGRILLTYDNPAGDIQAEIIDPRAATTITVEASDQQTTARANLDTTLLGSSGADTLYGQDGDDELFGGSSVDTLYGGDGDDILDGGLFLDQSFGGAGDDTFVIAAGNAADDVFGGSGTDTLDFSASLLGGDVTFTNGGFGTYLGSGYDFSGIAVIIGNNVNRTWDLFFGTQSVVAGSGDDVFIHGAGEFVDNLDAGGGTDTFDASAETAAGNGIEVDIGAGTLTGLGGTRVFEGFEIIQGTQADDTITGSSGDETFFGNDGNDTLDGGAGDDELYGGDGDDVFDKTNGSDSWYGGAGNDIFNGLNSSDTDTVNGGSGFDTYSVQGSASQWTLANNIATAGFHSTTLSSIEAFIGSNQDDDIDESNGAINEFYGGGGDDIIRTNGFNSLSETFDGGAGIDTLDYSDETGNTTFDMTAGTLTGAGAATDFENAIGGSGNDTIIGTSGDNTINGGGGDDNLTGSGGSNTYIVADDGGTNVINGSTSLDTIDVSGFTSGIVLGTASSPNLTGSDDLVSGNGTVIVNANREAKTLIATDFDDVINEFFIDVIFAGAGDDEVIVYQSASTNESYFGGSGVDLLNLADGIDSSFDSTYGTVNLSTGALTGTGGAFGFENVIGTEGANTITGTTGDNKLDGAGGDDVIFGGLGNDILIGGEGNDSIEGDIGVDSINGGDGVDTVYGGDGNDTVRGGDGVDQLFGDDGDDRMFGGGDTDSMFGGGGDDELRSGAGNSNMRGGTGDDRLLGNSDQDFLYGDGDADVLIGFLGNDFLSGGSGDDTFLRGLGGDDDIFGGSGNDRLEGGTGNDLLNGGSGDDRQNGGAGNDDVFGSTGNDILSGGLGEDFIDGGSGNDVLFGEAAGFGGLGQTDTFFFNDLHGTDRIRDWKDGSDVIDFSFHSAYSNFADVLASISQTGSSVRIQSSPTDILIIENALVGNFDASDFIF